MNLPEDRPDARSTAAADGVRGGADGDVRRTADAATDRAADLPVAGLSASAPDADTGSNTDTDTGADTGADTDTDTDTDTAVAPARTSRLPVVLILATAILVVDQITKIIAVATLTPGISPRILGGVVYFSLLYNPGAAFSLGTGMTWILAIVACVVVVVIVRIASRLRSGWWATCLGLILGGAVGNLMDRFFRAPGFLQGHVVDFVSVFGPDAQYFPVFNVADSSITIGAVLLVLASLRGIELDGTRAREKSGADDTTASRTGDA